MQMLLWDPTKGCIRMRRGNIAMRKESCIPPRVTDGEDIFKNIRIPQLWALWNGWINDEWAEESVGTAVSIVICVSPPLLQQDPHQQSLTFRWEKKSVCIIISCIYLFCPMFDRPISETMWSWFDLVLYTLVMGYGLFPHYYMSILYDKCTPDEISSWAQPEQ